MSHSLTADQADIAVTEARTWLRDIGDTQSPRRDASSVIVTVQRNYVGGWQAFLSDIRPLLADES